MRGTIYLAGRYSRREELNGYAEDLRALGFTVDARWLLGLHQYGEDADRAEADLGTHDDLAQRFALEDVEDLLRADICVSFTETPRQPSTNRGGRHVEFGLARGWGKILVLVGPRENAFHYLPGVVHIPDWATALVWLEQWM